MSTAARSRGAELRIHAMSPFLAFKDSSAAISFYIKALGASERFRLTSQDGARVDHAEITIGDQAFFLCDEYPDFGALSPLSLGGSPVKFHLSVDDCDAWVARAEGAGATVLRRPKLEFFGERTALIADPFGYSWFFATPVEEVSPAEMQRRWQAALKGEA